MLNVLMLTKYARKGASSRLRSFQYIPFLTENNCNISIQSLFDEDYLNNLYEKKKNSKAHIIKLFFKRFLCLLTIYKYDVIWIEKELFPYMPAVFERILPFLNIHYIVDYDDAIFHNYDLSSNVLIRTLMAKKIDVVMKNSHTVIAGNGYLAERAKNAGAKRVEIIPTVIDRKRYDITPFTSSRDSNAVLTVGWIGSPSTQKYVVQIKDALIELSKKFNLRVLLVGATSDIKDDLSDLNVDIRAWSESTEVYTILEMDVGIMPLEDGPWEKGKCGYKLIQYMACSVPVVASPVGVNVDIVNSNNCGLLAFDLADWQKHLTYLLQNLENRMNLGINGQYAVKNKYSLQVQRSKIFKVITDLTAC